MRTKPLSIVCVCVCVCVCIYIHALMIRKESCKCVGINVWRKSGSREKEGEEQKKEWCLPSHKKRFQAFRVLKFRVFGGVFFGFISREIRDHHQRKEQRGFWGCLSIVFARRTTHDKSALLRAILYRFSLSLSLSSSSSSLWLFWVQQQHQPTKGASTTSLSLLCDVVLKIQKERERERETYRKERHTHA